MKRVFVTINLLFACLSLFAQEWSIPIESGKAWGFKEFVTTEDGNHALGVGSISNDNGYLAKFSKDGEYISRTVHLPGMVLCYYSVIQLDNGNYMVFGVCEDSICDPDFQKLLRIDIIDDNLESVASQMISVDDDSFDCFSYPSGLLIKSILSPSGTIILATTPAYYVEQFGYYQRAIQFYELDQNGDIIQVKPIKNAYASSIEKMTYEPNSDNIMVVVEGGSFPSFTGYPGIYVVDSNLDIVARQHLINVQGGIGDNVDRIDKISTEGRWIDEDRMIFHFNKYLRHRSSFTYTTLCKVDSALNVYAELRLPPEDSCTWMPEGTSTAYINDSTFFAFTDCAETMLSFDTYQANVCLVDINFNLLGRKVIKTDHVVSYWRQPTILNDGGCLVPLYTRNGDYYPGEPFFQGYMVKVRREDIEITWDVVNEPLMETSSSAFPNPTSSIINIPIPLDRITNGVTRIQIFDIKGMKSLDCIISKSGNLITIDTQNLESGLYIYKIVSENVLLAEGKFVKE